VIAGVTTKVVNAAAHQGDPLPGVVLAVCRAITLM
jgi:hypothetical protein